MLDAATALGPMPFGSAAHGDPPTTRYGRRIRRFDQAPWRQVVTEFGFGKCAAEKKENVGSAFSNETV